MACEYRSSNLSEMFLRSLLEDLLGRSNVAFVGDFALDHVHYTSISAHSSIKTFSSGAVALQVLEVS